MSTENLRLHIAQIFLTAILALTIAGCAKEDAPANFKNDCTPLEWTTSLPRNDTLLVGHIEFINSGGAIIVVPSTRMQPTVVDGELQMTTKSGILVTEVIDSGNITFRDEGTYYQIEQSQQPFGTIEATIIQTCNDSSQAIIR